MDRHLPTRSPAATVHQTFRFRHRQAIFVVSRIALAGYFGVVVLLAFLQRKLLYAPEPALELPVAAHADLMQAFPAARDIELVCDDNVTIKGWLLQKQAALEGAPGQIQRPLVILFHGNAGNRATRGPWYHLLNGVGVDVLTIDYHGYGDSGGTMSETALELDCHAVWQFAVQELQYPPPRIIVMGTSLGGAAAVYLTAWQCVRKTPPAGMIVVATFSSMSDAGSSHYPWLPVRLVLVDRYPSDSRIGKVTCPVLFFHGDQDEIVDQQLGQKLFQAAPEHSALGLPRQWVNLPGVGHQNIASAAGDVITEKMREFVAQTIDHPSRQPPLP